MMVTLSFAGMRKQLKLGVKIILLALIVCYILPQLVMLFLNLDYPHKPPDEQFLEKPLRVMANNPFFKVT